MVSRRGFLKLLPTTAKALPAKAVESTTQQVKNTIGAALKYDGQVRALKKKGDRLATRRKFLERAKVRGGVVLMKSPKETNAMLGSVKKGLMGSLSNLDPMTVAEKTARVRLPGWVGVLKNFKEELYYLCDF